MVSPDGESRWCPPQSYKVWDDGASRETPLKSWHCGTVALWQCGTVALWHCGTGRTDLRRIRCAKAGKGNGGDKKGGSRKECEELVRVKSSGHRRESGSKELIS